MSGAIRVATRGSALARRQTEEATARLGSHDPALLCTIVLVQAAGDLEPDTPPEAMAGDGWFSSALERSLLEGEADLAVHSAKDLPSRLAPGLVVAGYLARADPRDAVVTRDGSPWRDLPAGARVATGSPRRAAQLLALRPDLSIGSIRGNVDTRLRRLAEGDADALVVAMAGLCRLGLVIGALPLDPGRECTPAPAQGAIALQARAGSIAAAAAAAVDDPVTRRCVEAERTVLAALGGGCRLPLGVLAEPEGGGRVTLTAAFADPASAPGTPLRRLTRRGDLGSVGALAADLAGALL
ncbi:MAG TPA: hydroxymethylbilane synthase [Candidatus Micrarchaeia archaeon]|nr:hydroxymethylbilane synthase [Candidatus Micrarchaeia archaeon]